MRSSVGLFFSVDQWFLLLSVTVSGLTSHTVLVAFFAVLGDVCGSGTVPLPHHGLHLHAFEHAVWRAALEVGQGVCSLENICRELKMFSGVYNRLMNRFNTINKQFY